MNKQMYKNLHRQARLTANASWGWYGKHCFGWQNTAQNSFVGSALLGNLLQVEAAKKLARLLF